jgi:group I intron endonuclease
MEERKYTVYIHTNKINNKAYIGITGKNVKQRWGKNGYRYKSNKHFWSAICKYKWENFEHIIFMTNLTQEEACHIEQLLIALYNTNNVAYGYNVSSGGENGFCGCHCSEEQRQKKSEAMKGLYIGEKNPMYGVSPKERMDKETYDHWKKNIQDRMSSEETKEKLRQANLGKKYSDEINVKKGRKDEAHPNYGKIMSEETKEKLRQAQTGKKYSDEINIKKGRKGILNHSARAVCQYDKDGTLVCRWSYATLASETLNINLSNIIACCQGAKGRKSAGGYLWKYEYDEEATI